MNVYEESHIVRSSAEWKKRLRSLYITYFQPQHKPEEFYCASVKKIEGLILALVQ